MKGIRLARCVDDQDTFQRRDGEFDDLVVALRRDVEMGTGGVYGHTLHSLANGNALDFEEGLRVQHGHFAGLDEAGEEPFAVGGEA